VLVKDATAYDPIRQQYVLRLDWGAPPDRDGFSGAVLGGLDRVDAGAISACSLAFEGSLRERLGSDLWFARPVPIGGLFDPVDRAALRRLGKLAAEREHETRGERESRDTAERIRFADASSIDASVSMEFELAVLRRGEVVGLASIYRALVDDLEPTGEQLTRMRSIVAPGASPADFEAAWMLAGEAESACETRSARTR